MTFNQVAEILLSKQWRFAKSMPTAPHWYSLEKSWADREQFAEVCKFINDNSYTEYFHKKPYLMFNLNGFKYWVMTINDEIPGIINRTFSTYNCEYDKIATKYQRLFQDDEAVRENIEVIAKIDFNGRVLDIGCGDGLLLDYKVIEPEYYTGIDKSKKMLEFFIQKHPAYRESIINTALEDFYCDHKFDTIVSLFGSPSYIDYDFLHTMLKTYLKKGGIAFLMFYANHYEPVTHQVTGVRPKIFTNDATGELYHNNYKIVSLSYEQIHE